MLLLSQEPMASRLDSDHHSGSVGPGSDMDLLCYSGYRC